MSFLNIIYAQVTIGSNSPPRDGAILDLKERDVNGDQANTDKGLGLPRVSLLSPNTLTIDDNSTAMEYIGQTVYNIANNQEMAEGMYVWDGTQWGLAVSVNDYGEIGQLLISQGNGTFGWSTFTVPDYKFHKPTQISVFEDGIKEDFVYSYSQVAGIPSEATFKDHFVYKVDLEVKTEISKPKYMLMGIAVNVYEMTRPNKLRPEKGFWQIVKVEVLIGDNNDVVKSYRRICSTPGMSNTNVDIDLYSIIPLASIDKGTHQLKIRVSNVQNTFASNKGNYEDEFDENRLDFYFVSLKDVSFALYEDE